MTVCGIGPIDGADLRIYGMNSNFGNSLLISNAIPGQIYLIANVGRAGIEVFRGARMSVAH